MQRPQMALSLIAINSAFLEGNLHDRSSSENHQPLIPSDSPPLALLDEDRRAAGMRKSDCMKLSTT